jgi:hypothetical protein
MSRFPLRNRSASSATASRKSASIRRTRSPLSRPQRTAQTPSPRASLDLRPPATPPPRSPSAPLQRALHSSPPMSAPPTVAHSPTPPAVHPLHQVPPLVAPDPISPYAYFEVRKGLSPPAERTHVPTTGLRRAGRTACRDPAGGVVTESTRVWHVVAAGGCTSEGSESVKWTLFVYIPRLVVTLE